MNEAPHPLDADDDDDAQATARRSRPAAPALAYRPLLNPSLAVAAVAVLTLFASSGLSVIAPPGSSANATSLIVFRISGVALVLALVGVLLAYRIGQLERKQPRLIQLSLPRMADVRFAVANVLGLLGLWLVLLSLGWALGGAASLIIGPLLMILAGLLATMIVWHRGYVRAFAIGGLTAMAMGILPMLLWSTALLFDGGFSNRTMRGPFNLLAVSAGVTLTIAQLSGLVSASYVVALESWRLRQPSGETRDQDPPRITR